MLGGGRRRRVVVALGADLGPCCRPTFVESSPALVEVGARSATSRSECGTLAVGWPAPSSATVEVALGVRDAGVGSPASSSAMVGGRRGGGGAACRLVQVALGGAGVELGNSGDRRRRRWCRWPAGCWSRSRSGCGVERAAWMWELRRRSGRRRLRRARCSRPRLGRRWYPSRAQRSRRLATNRQGPQGSLGTTPATCAPCPRCACDLDESMPATRPPSASSSPAPGPTATAIAELEVLLRGPVAARGARDPLVAELD